MLYAFKKMMFVILDAAGLLSALVYSLALCQERSVNEGILLPRRIVLREQGADGGGIRYKSGGVVSGGRQGEEGSGCQRGGCNHVCVC